MLSDKELTTRDEVIIQDLLNQSWKFRSTPEFLQFFTFIARFKHYSRYNTMLVYVQNRGVTLFGGISYWYKKYNRRINDDARPYIILTPDGPIMLVYDIFDTWGRETPEEFLKRGLGQAPFEVDGSLPKRALEFAMEEAGKWGIKISYKPLSYFNAGYVTTVYSGYLEIGLKQGMSAEENFHTLIHELAHLFLGHTLRLELHYTGKARPKALPQRKLSKQAKELEAETVSFLVCKRLGLEPRSAQYLAGYIRSKDDLSEFDYSLVINCADKIDRLFVVTS